MSDERTTPYTTKELSEAAGVNQSYIRQLLIAGKLTGEKLGRDWLIPADVAQRWLEDRRERMEKH